ncbi:myelin and lymphocyte [Pelobates cultripes]|uniref:Myelin and lymphocyte protein n=1 Tax=Pelobates cultripes TaxID=61616 RepID=A0AAD1RGZ4_PELCU|nr:myelin and lymphocyte [Pelobates cultripes]
MAATTPQSLYADVSALPSGLQVFTAFPDVLMIPELILGGLVWILVASARVVDPLSQGWIMFVSVTLFIFTFITIILYAAGVHKGKSLWTTFDAFYHFVSALFYLSAAVLQAYVTVGLSYLNIDFKTYQLNIAAVVFAYFATFVYVTHAVFSLLRWKKS